MEGGGEGGGGGLGGAGRAGRGDAGAGAGGRPTVATFAGGMKGDGRRKGVQRTSRVAGDSPSAGPGRLALALQRAFPKLPP